MVKADLKHWFYRIRPNENIDLERIYSKFSENASKRLGEDGIVGIVNARGEGHPNGPDYRFEQVIEKVNLKRYGDGRLALDLKNGIFLLKGQELNIGFSDENNKKRNLVCLAYNIPFGKNLLEKFDKFSEKDVEDYLKTQKQTGAFFILSAPSCADATSYLINKESKIRYLFDAIISYSGSHAILRTNGKAKNFHYLNAFVGDVAVSGGHYPSSVGTSNTKLKSDIKLNLAVLENPQDTKKYFEVLRKDITTTRTEDRETKPLIIETLNWLPRRIIDQIIRGHK